MTGSLALGAVNNTKYQDFTIYRGSNGNCIYLCGMNDANGGQLGISNTASGVTNAITLRTDKTYSEKDFQAPVLISVKNNRTSSISTENTSYCHLNTNADVGFHFNKNVYVQGNIYAGTWYNNLVLTTENYPSYLDSRYVNTAGDTMTGQLKLAITGGGWYNPVANPSTAGLSYDASGSTGSTYWPIVNLKFPNSTFSLGGERATDIYGIFRYANTRTENGYDAGFYCNGSNNYFYCTTRVYGAVWNDYAEFRNQNNEIEPGYCVASTNSGKVHKTTEHLQACDGIVSDTYGFSIGETDECKTPLAVSGRVLAYCEGDKYDYNAGDTVGASENGKVIKMTREEIKGYPDRIVGIVSEIPEYETWGTGNVKVDGRIWIKVK